MKRLIFAASLLVAVPAVAQVQPPFQPPAQSPLAAAQQKLNTQFGMLNGQLQNTAEALADYERTAAMLQNAAAPVKPALAPKPPVPPQVKAAPSALPHPSSGAAAPKPAPPTIPAKP